MDAKYTPKAEDTEKDIRNFSFHSVGTNQRQRMELIRVIMSNVASEIRYNTPPGREQALAITKLEEVMFWANAAISRNESPN